MVNKKRIVVTGIGIVSCAGNNIERTWENCRNGKSGIDFVKNFDSKRFPVKIAGQVKNFSLSRDIEKKYGDCLPGLTLAGKYFLNAFEEALTDSKIELNSDAANGAGIISGITGNYIPDITDRMLDKFYGAFDGVNYDREKINDFFDSNAASKNFLNYTTILPSIKNNLHGPNKLLHNACSSGLNAVIESYYLIKSGISSIMFAGATDALANMTGLTVFSLIESLSNTPEPEKASRPFDLKRNGFVLSEGSSVIVIEDLEHALERNAKIYCEIAGFGGSLNAFRVTDLPPDGNSGIYALKKAIEIAGIKPEQIDYINAHGTSTVINDSIETRIIKGVFKDYAYKIPVSSNKSMIGHMISASGIAELILTIKTVVDGFILPTINYENEDPDCDLDYVPNTGRKKEVRYAMSNSFGFGGQNSSIIIKKYEKGEPDFIT